MTNHPELPDFEALKETDFGRSRVQQESGGESTLSQIRRDAARYSEKARTRTLALLDKEVGRYLRKNSV